MIRKAYLSDIHCIEKWMKNLVTHLQNTSADVYLKDLEEDHAQGFDAWLREYIQSENSLVLVAEESNQPVGFILGQLTEPYIKASKIKQIGRIEACWIEPQWREKGYATCLVQEIESWFRLKGVTYSDLYFIVGNTEAEKTWSNLGYSPYRVASRKPL